MRKSADASAVCPSACVSISDEAEQEYKWHASLYKTYKQSPRMTTMQTHCHRLMHIYKSEAKEDRVMADQYKQLAEKAK
jgi:hypothetical protein